MWLLPVVSLCWPLLGAAPTQGLCNEGEYLAGAIRNPSFEEYITPPPSIWWQTREKSCGAFGIECYLTPHWQKLENTVVTTIRDDTFAGSYGAQILSLSPHVKVKQNVTLEPLTEYKLEFFARKYTNTASGQFYVHVEGTEVFRGTIQTIGIAYAWYTVHFTSLDQKVHELALSQGSGNAVAHVDIVSITNPAGDRCLPCDRGYESPNGDFCDDVDECSLPNACEHAACTNTQGSFFCTCNPGYSWNHTASRCELIWTDGSCWFDDQSVPSTDLSDVLRWPVGTGDRPMPAGDGASHRTVNGSNYSWVWGGAVTLVSTASFPLMHQGRVPDQVLFDVGDGRAGLWAGILDNKLHVRAGSATEEIQQSVVAANVSYLTTDCVPADGAPHIVTVDLDWGRPGHIRLWIDRLYVDQGTDMARNVSAWAGSGQPWVGYGIGAGPVPAGTVGYEWVGGLHHELLVYPGRTVGGCDVEQAASVCPSCTDGMQNSVEQGVDCGGTCGECDPCKQGDARVPLKNPSFEADAWAGGGAHQIEPSGWTGQGATVVRREYTCIELGGSLVEDSGLCLVLSPNKFATWAGAEAHCRDLGGHLAAITSAAANEAAWALYVRSGFSRDVRVHVGLTNHPSLLASAQGSACAAQPASSSCNAYGNGFAWADGSNVTFQSFRGDAGTPLSCASLARLAGDETRGWELGSCWEQLPFLCGVPTMERTSTSSPSPCSQLGGVETPDMRRCLFVPESSKPWAEAEAECVSHGGHLASVRSLEEHWMVSALRLRQAAPEPWIGLTCDEAVVEGASAANGVWKWVDESAWSLTYWPEGHYHNPSLQCAALRLGSGVDAAATWLQSNCATSRPFVCAVETAPLPPPSYTCNETCVKSECREDTETEPELVEVGSGFCTSKSNLRPKCRITLSIATDKPVQALRLTISAQQTAYAHRTYKIGQVTVNGKAVVLSDNLSRTGQQNCNVWKTVVDMARLPNDMTASTTLEVYMTANSGYGACTSKRLFLNAEVKVYGEIKPPPICHCSAFSQPGALANLHSTDTSFLALPAPGASVVQTLQLVHSQRYHLSFMAAASQCQGERGGELQVRLHEQELLRVQPNPARFQAYEVTFVAHSVGPLVLVNVGAAAGAPVFVDAVALESRCPYTGDAGVDDMATSCGVFRNSSLARPSLLHLEFATQALLSDSSLFGRDAAVHRGRPVSTMSGCARGGCVYLAGEAVLRTGALRLDGTKAGLTIGVWWRCELVQAEEAVLLELTGVPRSGGVRGVRITVAAEGRADRLRLEHEGGHTELITDPELASGSWQQLRWAVSWDGWKVWLGSRLVTVIRGTSVPDLEVQEGYLAGSGAGEARFRGWMDEVRVEPQAEHGDHLYLYHALDAGRFGLDASVKGRHLPPPTSGVWTQEPERECMFGSCFRVGEGRSLPLPELQLNAVLNGLTVSMWFRRPATQPESAWWAVLLDLVGKQNGRERIRLLLNLDGSSMLVALVEGVVDLVVDNEVVAKPGWHHVMLSMAAGHVQLVVDGVLAEWIGTASPAWTVQHGTVGALSLASTQRIMGMPLQSFSGWVDEISIHDAPCTQLVPTCPDGWHTVRSDEGVARCLLVADAAASFEGAAARCAAVDARLPSPSSKADSEAILRLARGGAWLSAVADSSGVLNWLDHTLVTVPGGVEWKNSSDKANASCLLVDGSEACGEPVGPCHGFQFASSTFKHGAHESESHGCAACASATVIVLDGVDDYLDLGALEFGLNLTYTAWVRVEAAKGTATVFDFGDESNANNHILAFFGAAGNLTFSTKNGSMTQQVTSPSVLPLHQWVHVAVTIAGTTARLYVEAVEAVSGSVFNLPVQSRSRSYIGRSNAEHAALFNGSIADLRMYGRAMSGAEVGAIRAGTNLFSADTLQLAGVGCHGRSAQCNVTTRWEKRECAQAAVVVCERSLLCADEMQSGGAKCLSCPCTGCATRRRLCETDPRGELKPQDQFHFSLHTLGVERVLQGFRQDMRESVSDVYEEAGLLVEACDGRGRVWCLPTPQLHGTFDLWFPAMPWERQRERVRQAGQAHAAFVDFEPPPSWPSRSEGEEEGFRVEHGAAAAGGGAALALVWYYRKKRREALEEAKAAAKVVKVRLVLVREGRETGEVRLEAGQAVTFGREAAPPLRVEHESCSRAHATLHLSEDSAVLTVVDLGTLNGTRVDGRQLQPHTPQRLGNGHNVVLAGSPVVLLVAGLPDKRSDAADGGSDAGIELAQLGRRGAESTTRSSTEGGVSGTLVFVSPGKNNGKTFRGLRRELRSEGALQAGSATPEFFVDVHGRMQRARSFEDVAEEAQQHDSWQRGSEDCGAGIGEAEDWSAREASAGKRQLRGGLTTRIDAEFPAPTKTVSPSSALCRRVSSESSEPLLH